MRKLRSKVRIVLTSVTLAVTGCALTACGNYVNIEHVGEVAISHDGKGTIHLHYKMCKEENPLERIEVRAVAADGKDHGQGLTGYGPLERAGEITFDPAVGGTLDIVLNVPDESNGGHAVTLPQDPQAPLWISSYPNQSGWQTNTGFEQVEMLVELSAITRAEIERVAPNTLITETWDSTRSESVLTQTSLTELEEFCQYVE